MEQGKLTYKRRSNLIPKNETYGFTASSENAFYYLKPYELQNKLVVIEDLDCTTGMLYNLRELQSKHYISKTVALKDASTGNTQTRKLEIFGPICLTATTTQERIYEDNANRCLLIYLDNSEEQEEAIMNYQRKLSAGKIDKSEELKAAMLLTNIQRMLKPITVINPYAEALRIPKECFKPLRTHAHYLQFIETVTWYHQYQREEKVNEETGEIYIKTTLEDIKNSNELLKDILLAKSDELPKSAREFFEGLKTWLKMKKKQCFYAKEYREYSRMYKMKLNRYLHELEGYGLIKRSGGNKRIGYEYTVVKWQDYAELKEGLTVLDDLYNQLVEKETREEVLMNE